MSVREVNMCSTCKWWSEPELEDRYIDTEDNYKYKFYSHRRCVCPKVVDTSEMAYREWDKLPVDVAVYSDREGYGASFRTGPGFGCVHWEAP